MPGGEYLTTLVRGDALLPVDTDIAITPPGYEDRYHEYVFPQTNIGTGFVATNLPLVTDYDADFLGFSWKMKTDVDFLFNFRDTEGRYKFSRNVRVLPMLAGTANHPVPFIIPLWVTRGGVLLFDITVNGTPPAGNLQIVITGVKRYPV